MRRSYHLLLSAPKQDAVVWANLNQLHLDNAWKSGVYEHEQYIESGLKISKGIGATYYYMLYDRMYHCHVKVLDHYPPQLPSDFFVLVSNSIICRERQGSHQCARRLCKLRLMVRHFSFFRLPNCFAKSFA